MAQIVPSLTSLPLDSTAAPSAEDIQNRLPSICVDYLSHDWAEEDVWASWRSMTRHKNEIANGVRLENASWRTWWKQRNKLRTISPETLNWLKDSDVTWLYGPLHTAVEPVPPPKVATTDERLGIVRHDKKPILKHRTLSEMLTIPMPSSPILESSNTRSDMDVDELDDVTGRPHLMHTKSDTNIVRNNRRISPPRGPIGSNSRTPTSTGSSTDDMAGVATAAQGRGQISPSQLAHANKSADIDTHVVAVAKRHISFNTFVEQCIAVDDQEDARGDNSSSEEDDSSDDGVLEIKSSSSMSSRSSRSSRPSLSRHSSSSSEHVTIAKIAPTMLKTSDTFPSPSPAVVYAPPEAYAELHRRRSSSSEEDGSVTTGGNGSGQYDFPSPPTAANPATSQWDDDDEYSVGFDYFSGPDLGVGDEYNTSRNQSAAVPGTGRTAVQSHVGSGPSYGGQSNGKSGPQSGQATPTVGQPPQQAKWRASNNAAVVGSGGGGGGGGGGGSSGGNSTASSATSTARPSPTLDPSSLPTSPPGQPGRSILKIRPPGSAPIAPEPTSPTSSYFNFNPSAATGFGGMGHRGPGREPAASSLPLYDVAQSTVSWQSNSVPPTGTVTPPIGTPYGTPASPINASGEGSERGRSAVRTSSLAERSLSRGTSTSASVSPNSIRSPVQIPAGVVSASTRHKSGPSPVDTASGGSNSQRVVTPPARVSPGSQSPSTSPGIFIPKLESPQPVKLQEPSTSTVDIISDDQRAGTPTPHSSPMITMGRMADTSPASLPHDQTDGPLGPTISKAGAGSASSAAATAISATQASTSYGNHFSPKRHQRSPSLPGGGSSEPPLNIRRSTGQPVGGIDDEEGGSMYGRAINIANTAKDLFGALWGYGAQPPPMAGQHLGGNIEDKEQSDGGPAF